MHCTSSTGFSSCHSPSQCCHFPYFFPDGKNCSKVQFQCWNDHCRGFQSGRVILSIMQLHFLKSESDSQIWSLIPKIKTKFTHTQTNSRNSGQPFVGIVILPSYDNALFNSFFSCLYMAHVHEHCAYSCNLKVFRLN